MQALRNTAVVADDVFTVKTKLVHASALPRAGTAPPPHLPAEIAVAVPADTAGFATPRRPTATGRSDAPDRTRSPRELSPFASDERRGKGRRPPHA